jgi:hypothetical protein
MPGAMPAIDERAMRIHLEMQTDTMKNQIAGLKGYITRLKTQIDGLNDRMGKMQSRINKVSRRTGQMRGNFARWLGVGLSVMFITQAISASLERMITPVLEITGVFEVWKATLISVLGPVLIPLALQLIKIMTWFMGLPMPAKKFIATLVLLGYVVTSVLASFSQLFLLLLSIGLPALLEGKGIMAALGVGLKGLSVALGWVAVAMAALYVIWDVLKDFFTGHWVKGLVKAILIAAAVIAGILLLPAELGALAIAAIITAVAFLITVIVNNWDKITAWLKTAGKAVWDAISWPFVKLYNFLKDMFAPYISIWGAITGKGKGEVSVGAYQEGGIVTRPTLALLGENGPEAVTPLGGGGGVNVNINITGNFAGPTGMQTLAGYVQVALRDELRRLGVR